MWKTVNSVYKSANDNIRKIKKKIPKLSTVSENINKIKIPNLSSISKYSSSNEQSQAQKAMNSIFKNKKPVMPINKMSIIAQMSYQSEQFQLICDLIFQKLRVFKYQSKYAKQTLNTLVLLSYLIKNAASGFIDQFRSQIIIFQQHSELSLQKSYVSDHKQIEKLKYLLVQIKQRSKYIAMLLTDKKKLLKQKEIAMEIKRKIMESSSLYNQNQSLSLGKEKVSKDSKENRSGNQNGINLFGNKESEEKILYNQKIDSFLQHYVWKYWNKFDEKLQNMTQKIIEKIDQYLDMEQPQSFQIQQMQVQNGQNQQRTLTNIQQDIRQKQIRFLKQKNNIQLSPQKQSGPILNTQLI